MAHCLVASNRTIFADILFLDQLEIAEIERGLID